MFTRRHYKAVALDFRAIYRCGAPNERETIDHVLWHLAETFAIDNASFNRVKFLDACGFIPAGKVESNV